MPFTPFHMGPGMVVKAAAPRHFSIVVFGLTQIAIDLEVLRHLARHDHAVHAFWHTYLGATIIAAVMMIVGKPVSQWAKRLWNYAAARGLEWDWTVDGRTTWPASCAGAVLGAYSHVFLDSMCHLDDRPLGPWSSANPLRGLVTCRDLGVGCLVLGVAGLVWFLERERRKRRGGRTAESSRR
jgi:hypothetical protein